MMSGFEHHRKSDRVIATFSGFEADLLRSLASQMVELLRNERAEPAPPSAAEATWKPIAPSACARPTRAGVRLISEAKTGAKQKPIAMRPTSDSVRVGSSQNRSAPRTAPRMQRRSVGTRGTRSAKTPKTIRPTIRAPQ